MDMVLYSLFKNKIANTPTGQVDNVGGYEIRFVDAIPDPREENFIYFVLGEHQDGDKVNVGGKGIKSIVFGDVMVDYGILNGNTFFNGFDYNREIERVLKTSTDGSFIVMPNTVDVPINHMLIKGQCKTDDRGQTVGGDSYLKQVNFYNDVLSQEEDGAYDITINKYFNALPNGMADSLDMTTGVYKQVLETATIDGTLRWQHVYLYGDYREFKCTGYDGSKPTFLTYTGSYNGEECLEITEENAFTIDSEFVTASENTCEGKECIYTENGSLYIRILNEKISGGSSYTSSLKKYLGANPISFSVGRVEPKPETILAVARRLPLKAIKDQTTIRTQCNTSFPYVEVELPVKKSN